MRDNGCFWWLRTIGMGAYEGRSCGKIEKRPPQATFVDPEGYIGRGMASSIPVVRNDTVRPALRIII